MLNTISTDVLVIGAGLTGLRAALAASQFGKKVLVLSKGPRCSYGVMGFNAAVGKEDSDKLYYEDILSSGKGLSNKKLAYILSKNSALELRYLESNGLNFEKTAQGEYDLLQPLGCSKPRLVHIGKSTGPESEKVFLEKLGQAGVLVAFDVTVLDLLVEKGRVYGALAVSQNQLVCYAASSVVVAAGGCGALYPVTTYPEGIQGDSYAMMARAGVELIDMEFIQFEPCCLAEPEILKGRGISTTMLNVGAKLLRADGHDFLSKYIPDIRYIQKGNLARAMYTEMGKTAWKPLLYDLRSISEEDLETHCLWTKELKACGLDTRIAPLKVCPAAHTFLGGAKVNERCETSVKGIFAAGEAMGGLHGANRIGGCAGAETYVFGAIAGESAAKYATGENFSQQAEMLARKIFTTYSPKGDEKYELIAIMRKRLSSCVSTGLSIVRNEQGIKASSETAAEIESSASRISWDNMSQLTACIELKNMALVSRIMSAASLARKESRGVFYRSDYPAQSEQFELNFIVSVQKGEITLSTKPDFHSD